MTTQSRTASVRRGLVFYALAGALVFQGLSGIAGGIGLVTDPTGGNVQIPVIGYHAQPPLQFVYGTLGCVIVGRALRLHSA